MDAALEATTMRKVYLRLLPFAVICYILAYIDRIKSLFAYERARTEPPEGFPKLPPLPLAPNSPVVPPSMRPPVAPPVFTSMLPSGSKPR